VLLLLLLLLLACCCAASAVAEAGLGGERDYAAFSATRTKKRRPPSASTCHRLASTDPAACHTSTAQCASPQKLPSSMPHPVGHAAKAVPRGGGGAAVASRRAATASKAIRLAPVAAASASSASPASRGRSPSVSNQHDERPSAHASSHALSWRTKAAKLLRPGEGAAGDGAREQPGEER